MMAKAISWIAFLFCTNSERLLFLFGDHVANQSFALDIKIFYPKQRCSSKKTTNARFSAATCVGRRAIHHRTRLE